ncbi:hypothetical protein [Azospirillum sp. TSO5]|uniref:hypothetical protein n=1 Tax=Azospirillum sp. TSO5 TaxID=716760 RepID=UPI0011B23327|nr:hypothetical protein [Azospirillum sp. TSO5]
MSDRLSTLFLKRRQFLGECGRAAVMALPDDLRPVFLTESLHLDQLVEDYGALRDQFVVRHGMGENLLANHKVAALYVWLLSKVPAEFLFRFPADAPVDSRRLVMATMMNAVIVGLLAIDPSRVDGLLQDDIEYCLLKEAPANLEWLCCTLHAHCLLNGARTNIPRY